MLHTRVKWDVRLQALPGVDTIFQAHTGIDPCHVPEKYEGAVERARAFVVDRLDAAFIYRYVEIQGIEAGAVHLEEGLHLSGAMPPKLLQRAEGVICYVGTLPGFPQQIEGIGDGLEAYFADIWGTACIEAAQARLADHLSDGLRGSGKKRTFLWSPGQHQFDLINQRPLFELLHPEDIGCTLTRKCRMEPIKSVSGVAGVVGQEEDAGASPCAYCSLHATCPASKAAGDRPLS